MNWTHHRKRLAWLPGREMFPDFRPVEDFCARAAHLLNQEIEVVELGSAFGQGHKLVSHVRVANDPWSNVAAWNDGDIKVMEVTAVTGERAIGFIQPGIRAEFVLATTHPLLPYSWGNFAKPAIGDELAGFFRRHHVDNQNRVVALDIEGYVRSRVAVADNLVSVEALRVIDVAARAPKEHDTNHFFADRRMKDIHTVLFVNDDDSFRKGVSELLSSKGCKVVASGTLNQALRAISEREEDFDLAIIDLQLGSGGHLPGIRVAQALHREQPSCPIVVVTGLDLDPRDPNLANTDLCVSRLIFKPFGFEELHEALSAVGNGPRPLINLVPGASPSANEPSPATGHPTERDEIAHLLDQLRQRVSAEAVVLFALHPVSYAVSIFARSDPRQLFQFVKPRVGESPIADVIIKGHTVQTDDALDPRERCKHLFLQKAYGYRSCIGIPVRLGLATAHGYGLFAFHSQERVFDSATKWEVSGIAKEIGYLLRIAAMNTGLQLEKSFAMMGKIYGSMAHDLSETLSAGISVRNLAARLSRGPTTPDPHIAAILKDLESKWQRAANIVKTFRDMARGTLLDATEFSVDQTLRAVTQRFQAEAEHHGITVRMVCAGPPCVVRMRETGLEQVLYNLLLNAAQQIEFLGDLRRADREIVVELRVRTELGDKHWADILVHDNGPGIHKCDFTRVFDLHYTTKNEGCGMGLDIARTIVEGVALGDRQGRIRVRRSILLAGTTFEVSLPVTIKEKGPHA